MDHGENHLPIFSPKKADFLVLGLDDAIYIELTWQCRESDFIKASTSNRLSGPVYFSQLKTELKFIWFYTIHHNIITKVLKSV